jgi:hypothetical protein
MEKLDTTPAIFCLPMAVTLPRDHYNNKATRSGKELDVSEKCTVASTRTEEEVQQEHKLRAHCNHGGDERNELCGAEHNL